jgi:PAS domain-containing protein
MHRHRYKFALLLLLHTANGFLRAGTCNTGRVAVAIGAKKGKKGKKGKQQKKSGMDWARDFEVMPFDSSVLRPLADAAAGAFEARTGKPLDASLAGAGDLPKALYKAPVCVMVVSDEKIAYANDAACEFAGKKHTELIGSATALPATVADGYDSSYEKKVDGNTMQKAKRWAISKMAVVDGELVTEDQGVGYAFEAWIRDEDGALCRPGGIVEAAPIDPAEIQAQIDSQAAVVRDLKEEQGLGNSDPEVKAAVAELLRLKAMLEE